MSQYLDVHGSPLLLKVNVYIDLEILPKKKRVIFFKEHTRLLEVKYVDIYCYMFF